MMAHILGRDLWESLTAGEGLLTHGPKADTMN